MRDRITAALVTLVLSLSLAAPVAAGPLEDGKAAYDRGDYAHALRLWRPLADQGHAGAQGVLGLMYFNGQGVPQDYVEAAKWYRKAADQGNAAAQYNLGLMYSTGRGVSRDYTEARKWYSKAADQGNADAQLDLGVMYAIGQGVPRDSVQAHKWFNLAASRFSASDAEKRSEAAAARDEEAAKMTPAQIAEAQKLAREWKPK